MATRSGLLGSFLAATVIAAAVACDGGGPIPAPDQTLEPIGNIAWEPGLYLIGADGAVDLLTNDIDDPLLLGYPDANYVWSPDGTRVTYVSERTDPNSSPLLTVLQLSDGERLQISLHPLAFVSGIAWQPGGRYIAVVGEPPAIVDANDAVVLVDVETASLSVLIDEENSGLEMRGVPSWAPDGEGLLVRIGGDGFAIINLDGSVEATIPEGIAAEWAPTGGHIAFGSGAGVYLATPDGEVKARWGGGSQPAWSPDGRLLAFIGPDPRLEGTLYIVEPGQQEAVALAQGGQPSWSPDARQIAFIRDGNLFVVGADGAGETQITNSPFPFLSRPLWSPSGSQILVRYAPGIESTVWVSNADGSDPRPLAPGWSPAWSPDGKSIAFLSGFAGFGINASLYVMRADGSDITRLGRVRRSDNIPPCAGGTKHPWSPDGKQLAFQNGGAIYVVDSEGSESPQHFADGFGPTWSRDGLSIAYADGGSPPEYCDIKTTQLDGQRSEEVLFEGGRMPLWSPSGDRIAFIRERAVHIGDPVDGKASPITPTSAPEKGSFGPYLLAWSPDGEWLAYYLDEDRSIYLVRADGTAQPVILSEGHSLEWSPDGTRIAFAQRDEGVDTTYTVSIDAPKDKVELIEGGSLEWSPDGSQITFTR